MALPGVRTTILDRFYNQVRTDLPGGPVIALLAKRNNSATTAAPDLVPFSATSEQEVIVQFGENSQIHKGFYELTTGGATRVYVVALPANTTFNHTAGTIASAGYTGALFDDAFSAVESVRADIVVPWGRGSDTYDWDDFATPSATPGRPDGLVPGTFDFFYADNSNNVNSSWAYKVGVKCMDITFNSFPVIAVMGLAPMVGPKALTPSQLATGLAFPNLINKEAATPYAFGEYLSIVAAETHPITAPAAWGLSNGACAYAALISRLPSWSATTNKPVYNTDQLRYNVSRVQAGSLNDRGIVCAQLDMSRVPKWTDGTTFAPSTSDYIRLSTVRIIYDAVKLIKAVAENYIGEGMSINMQNAFQTQISSSLQSMTKLGAINKSDFRVRYAPTENRAYVDLALVPAFELREVIISLSVNF